MSEQIGDNVQNDNITAIKENFVVEFSLIFDVLYNQWLHAHEPRVTESVLEALGPITRLISERKFDETVNKFVLSLLALYKKTAINPYYISQCISYLLTLSPLNPKLSLNDNVINSLNHILFTLVLLEPDYDQPHTVKNHFEVLRCFDHLAGQFPDPTVEGLLHHCKSNHEKERMKAVIVLTHLTTSSQMFIEKFSTKFIAILKVMTAMEQSLKMKKLLVKAIVGLAYRNCISGAEDFTMVEFIVKNCGYEAGPNVAKDEVFELQDTCRSSLIIMCNTVVSVRTQLRTLLLQSLTLEDFTPSITTVAHCLTALLQNNSAVSSEDQDASSQPTATPELVFVRCIIYLVERDEVERNKNLLLFLEEYSGDIHKNLKNEWTIEIQRLLKYVDRKETSEEWHGMLLNLLVLAIEQVNNNKWTENISVSLSNQILKTKQSTMIKGMSLQYLAIVSCHLSNAAIVENVLKIILFSLKSIPLESCEYVSKAVSIASRRHGEYVLNELDLIYKDIEGKRSSKILNFLSSKHSKTDAELTVVKYAVITCYGKVAVECFDVHVLARLAENVTNILYEILKAYPQIDLCKASITTLYQICKALQPAAHHNIVLRNRWQILTTVLDQIQSTNLDKRNIEIYPLVVKAVKALTKLQKGAVPEERNTILKIIFGTIFGELQSYNKMNEAEDNKTNMRAKILNDSLVLVHGLVRELIIQSTCLSTLDDLVSLLVQWLCHEDSEIRMAIVLLLQVIFETYIKNVKINYESPSKFGQMGYLLGIVMPGVADTNFQVRQITVDCVKIIIQIQDLYEGHIVDPEDECMKALASFHNDILTNDLSMIREYCHSLCEKIYEKIPHQYTMQFVESLLESFDNHEYRSTGISAILNALFVKIGLDMYQNIERILEVILDTMMRVPEHQQKLLPAVASLARHHSNAVTAVLLGQKIPLKE